MSKETITPEKAAEWLKSNKNNRHLRKSFVEELAADIVAGRWVYNGATIRFDKHNRLVDGQHRLEACVLSGIAIVSEVVRGLEPNAHSTIDSGIKRSLADELAYRGSINVYALASVVSMVWRYLTGRAAAGGAPSVNEALALMRKFPDLVDAANDGRAMCRQFEAIPQRVWGLLVWGFVRAGGEDARAALRDLASGANLTSDDPLRILRSRLVNEASSHRKTNGTEIAALAIKAMNARMAGETPRYLKWVRFGEKREEFPTISGLEASWHDWRDRIKGGGE